ncbi:MAG: hypothetical protein PHS14_19085 [Elusimicrobia bacterium]|nr:hypothetical protein [Elusimicrobiota bacterium]
MRNVLIRLAPCAVFVSALASAQVVEKPVAGGSNAGPPAVATGAGVNSPSGTLGGANTTGLGLQPGVGGVAVSPAPTPGAATPAAVNPVSPVPGAALPIKTVGGAASTTARPVVQKANPASQSGEPLNRTAKTQGNAPDAAKTEAPGVKEAPTASSALDTAARGIEDGRKTEAAGGDGLSVRQALDRAYDSSMRAGNVGGGEGVAGKFSSAREKVAGLVGIANNSAPADAPGLYGSAIKTAEQTLPAAAAAAVTKTVLSFAMGKADFSLSALAQAAYDAATVGQTAEARRLVKSLDKWEDLLASPGRPLIVNGDRLKAGVELALSDAAKIPGAKRSAPRVWVVKRGESFVAALPGTTVEKVPGLAASFALKLEKLSAAPLADAYRAFVARPGARSAIAARVAMGESVPSAAISTGWLWLKYMVVRAWSALTSLLPGRGLPSVANAGTMPRLREAAKAWRDAALIGDAAARAAGSTRLTVARARGAFTLARRAAAAHEALTGQNGAVSRVDSLSSEFEAGVARAALSPADRLTSGLEAIVSGDGGLRHWASRYASDAREVGSAAFLKLRGASPVMVLGDGPGALAATALAAASKGMSFTAFGDALWASGSGNYGQTKLSADLRSTESGGSLALETQRGDEKLAASLDELGFSVTRKGRGLSATLDAQTMSADAREMTELASDAAALIAGAPAAAKPSPSEGLNRLLADMKRSPKAAAKTAASLDGTSRLSRAKTVGWVGDYEAVSAEIRSSGVRVIALRDPATGLSKFARIEPLRVR